MKSILGNEPYPAIKCRAVPKTSNWPIAVAAFCPPSVPLGSALLLIVHNEPACPKGADSTTALASLIPPTDNVTWGTDNALAPVATGLLAVTWRSVDESAPAVDAVVPTIAVGTAVAGGPPRRSGREGLPHPAPALSRA